MDKKNVQNRKSEILFGKKLCNTDFLGFSFFIVKSIPKQVTMQKL
uniref:Uncharacterized protein n=1 Tax=viral metagenome TaxID=1070528 RepID=A0A6C0HDS1_9ZZZZ